MCSVIFCGMLCAALVWFVLGSAFFAGIFSRAYGLFHYVWLVMVFCGKLVLLGLILKIAFELTRYGYNQSFSVRQHLIMLRNTTGPKATFRILAEVLKVALPFVGAMGTLIFLKWFFYDWSALNYGLYACFITVTAMPLIFPDNVVNKIGISDEKVFTLAKSAFALHVAYSLYLHYLF